MSRFILSALALSSMVACDDQADRMDASFEDTGMDADADAERSDGLSPYGVIDVANVTGCNSWKKVDMNDAAELICEHDFVTSSYSGVYFVVRDLVSGTNTTLTQQIPYLEAYGTMGDNGDLALTGWNATVTTGVGYRVTASGTTTNLPGAVPIVRDVNARGDVLLANNQIFLANGSISTIGDSTYLASATDLNLFGAAAGTYTEARTGISGSFFWDDRGLWRLAANAKAVRLNDLGEVAGTVAGSCGSVTACPVGTVWNTMNWPFEQRLALPTGYTMSQPVDIQRDGRVLGSVWYSTGGIPSSTISTSGIWTRNQLQGTSTFTDLSTMIPPGWRIVSVQELADNGMILAIADNGWGPRPVILFPR